MKELFSIGPFTVHFFGVMIAIGVIVGLLVALREAERKNLDHAKIFNLLLYTLLGGFLGARLVYVFIYNPGYYLSNPVDILYVHQGGLSIHGGIAGGIIAGVLYARTAKLPLWRTSDALIPALILGQAIGRVGCDVFGVPMENQYFWGIQVQNSLLHPVQVYEFILNYLLFGYLWVKRLNIRYDGQLLVNYLLFFPVIRGIVELFRTNPIFLGSISVAHLMSVIFIIFALGLRSVLIKHSYYPKKATGLKKSEVLKTTIFILALIVLSLMIFYGVQGV
ncbi:prolipoprotein diacylglyceryl transferase [Desulfitibacter alkalitolerans]|uniref:prolipoprotein diacylglyceryl transferase n=1 Tax=Desulfitibacter alkalitolerans TaxID=264641 RepID=UPI000482B23B|nr:prolipoprotein diacylglyceryl transferase [Desulfitibacter alkalitolerans]